MTKLHLVESQARLTVLPVESERLHDEQRLWHLLLRVMAPFIVVDVMAGLVLFLAIGHDTGVSVTLALVIALYVAAPVLVECVLLLGSFHLMNRSALSLSLAGAAKGVLYLVTTIMVINSLDVILSIAQQNAMTCVSSVHPATSCSGALFAPTSILLTTLVLAVGAGLIYSSWSVHRYSLLLKRMLR